jgi:very-short-patch-repair endonuclease
MGQHMAELSSAESVDARIARLAAARHGVFTRTQALDSGAHRGIIEGRLKSSRWELLYPGVYRLAGIPESWRQRLYAARLAAGAGAVASHRAGAALWRFPGAPEGVLEISVPIGRRVRRSGIIVHEVRGLASIDVTEIDAIPVTTATRTLIDFAGIVVPDIVEEALDDVLRRRQTSIPRLRKRIAELGRRGRSGAGVLNDLIEARREPASSSESVLETRFLRLVRRAGLPLPVSQHLVRDQGRVLARVDFAYPEALLAIEVDGYRWHSGRVPWERDLGRRNELTARGWRVIHVTSTDLERRPDQITGLIAAALASRT